MPDYGPLYSTAGNQWGIDPLLLQSMAREESAEDPNAVGPVIQSGPAAGQHALGFMQFLPSTAKQYSVDTSNPSSSVFGAANYMADLLYKQNLPLRQSLATYGGTSGNPNSDYVTKVMNRYKALKAAWSAQPDAPPTTDTDPASPTVGEPTYKNVRIPGDLTTAKGNPGQPAPSVPTTDNQPGVSMAAPSLVPPEQGGPKGQRTAAPAAAAPSHISDIPVTHNEDGTPVTPPATPGQPAPKSAIADIPVTHNEDGSPIGTPYQVDTGEYLTAPTSPGAKAVGLGALPKGTTFAEDKVPGPDFQAAIALASDPAQKARIAGHWLFPDMPAGQAADRIIIGPGGRMAAVPDSGQPYFIEPAPVFNPQTGVTRAATDQGPNLRQLAWSGSQAVSDNANQPPGPWTKDLGWFSSPYSRATPLGPGATPSNIPLAMGGAIPNTVQNALTWVPAGAGPILGPTLVGAASAGTTAARNALANYFDPDKSRMPPVYTPEDTKKAMINTALAAGFGIGGRLLAPEIAATVPSGGEANPLATIPTSRTGTQWPFGGGIGPEADYLGGSTQFPAAGPSRGVAGLYEGRQPMPIGPNLPLEARPLAPGTVAEPGAPALPPPAVVLDPMEGTADKTGPYAATTHAEIAAQPTRITPPSTPIFTKQGIEDRADQIIREAASVGNKTPDTRDLITHADLGQTTGNPGINGLIRYLSTSTPYGEAVFGAFRAAQLALRRTFTKNLVGTPDDLVERQAARAANTQQNYDAAFGPGQTSSVSPQPVLDKIEQILRSPEGVRSVVGDPLRQIRDMFYEKDPLTGKLPLDANGNPIRTLMTDPERLYKVRQDINDSMRNPMANSTLPDARGASHVLGEVLHSLDDTIASGAPNYPEYMKQYAAQSKEINAMKFLQGRNLTDSNGDTTVAKVDSAIKAAERDRNLDPRQRPADALSDDQMNQLYTLRDDLRRQANTIKGKAFGSDTQQNFSTSAFYNTFAGPMATRLKMLAAGAIAAKTGGVGHALYGLAEPVIENVLTGPARKTAQQIDEAVIRRLLNTDGSGTRALTGQPALGREP